MQRNLSKPNKSTEKTHTHRQTHTHTGGTDVHTHILGRTPFKIKRDKQENNVKDTFILLSYVGPIQISS